MASSKVPSSLLPVPSPPSPLLPVASPLLPVARPLLPVASPLLPVANPLLPVASPLLPVASPLLPVASPLLPVSSPQYGHLPQVFQGSLCCRGGLVHLLTSALMQCTCEHVYSAVDQGAGKVFWQGLPLGEVL